MAEEKKHYDRYWYVHGTLTLWRGDPAKDGSAFRQFSITSNEVFSMNGGVYQVFGLEAISGGIKEGRLAMSEPKLISDEDCDGLEAATKKFDDLVSKSKDRGFRERTMGETVKFEDKIRHAREHE
jgi:hypothetical protein